MCAKMSLSESHTREKLSSSSSHQRQYLVCGILCLGGFLAGTGQGWSSPALPSLKSTGHFPELITSQSSWIAALSMLGAFASSPPGGYLIRQFGRKNTLLLTAFPYLFGWILLAFPTQVWMLYTGRFLVGTGLGLVILATSVYMSEIAEPELRGRMSVIWFVALRLGIIFEYGVGSVLPYNQLSLISAAISVAFGVSIFFIPESPRWLMTKWKREKAIDSLCWSRACDKSSPSTEILAEVQEIEDAVLRAEKESVGSFTILSTYFTNGAVLKSVLIAGILLFAKEGCGGNVFSFYNVQVFEKTGSAVETHLSTVLVGIAQLLGILLTTYYVDRIGRRILLLITFVTMTLSLIVIGFYCQFRMEISGVMQYSGLIPLITLAIYHAAFSGGPFVLTYTVMSEVIPTNVIGSISGLLTSFGWITAFVWIRCYEDINEEIGVANTFWVFALVSAICVVCIHLFVPETVGKCLENIHKNHDQNFNSDSRTVEENIKD